jgi:enterochelin esterase-like enzyme
MKNRFRILAMVAGVGLMIQLSAPLPLNGQTPRPATPAPPGAPGSGAAPGANPLLARGPALLSPEVGPDRRVTFRFAAPNATQVTVTGIAAAPITMQKDERGVWTGTSEPLAPEIYQYNFMVDGARVTDPSNARLMASYHRMDRSYLLVPGDNPWTPVAGTPRGAVARHLYHSAVTNEEREFYVYTPPGYDPKRRKPYPVIFLQHGLGGDAHDWIQQGGNTTLDNLISQGKAVPMIMVASLGYGTPNGPADIDHPEMQRNFMRTLTEEVMPVVYKQYNASTNPADHAIAGLSMGGAQAVFGGLNKLDKFAWFGGFSAALVNWAHTIPFAEPPAPPEVVAAAEAAQAKAAAAEAAARAAPPQAPAPPPARPGAPGGPIVRNFGAGPVFDARLPLRLPNLNAQSNKQIKLLWMGIGGDDPSIETHKQLRAYLDARGVKYTYVEIPNQRHWWPLWHRHFAEFAQLIFK